MKLLSAFHSSVDFDDTSYGASHNASILSIYYIESRGAAVHLACEERKEYQADYDVKGGIIDITDERTEPVELLVCDCGSPRSDREIRLRPWTLHWYAACPAVVDTFNQMVEICGPAGGDFSAEWMINREMSWIFRQSFSNTPSRNNEPLGTLSSEFKRRRQRLLFLSVVAKSDLSIKLPLATSNVV